MLLHLVFITPIVGSKCDIPIVWEHKTWQAGCCLSLVRKSTTGKNSQVSEAQSTAVLFGAYH